MIRLRNYRLIRLRGWPKKKSWEKNKKQLKIRGESCWNRRLFLKKSATFCKAGNRNCNAIENSLSFLNVWSPTSRVRKVACRATRILKASVIFRIFKIDSEALRKKIQTLINGNSRSTKKWKMWRWARRRSLVSCRQNYMISRGRWPMNKMKLRR